KGSRSERLMAMHAALTPISQIAVALCLALLALLALRGRATSIVHRSFAAQSLIFAGWVLGLSGIHNEATVNYSFALAFAFGSLIPVGFLFFSHYYPTNTTWSPPKIVRAAFIVGAVLAVLALSTRLIVADAHITTAGVARTTGPL